ncbi:methyltransferase domain-containing protein, partial [Peptococcaceae bacterium]|nr:methyltransferase domain-containing protein [Peptococcaceae bacterium]
TFKTERELQEAILKEKAKGTPDFEIGQKYGVTFRYIERLITKTQGLNISALKVSKKIKRLHPKDFKEEKTTVWSFKQRGNWATHSGEYRGNWSPYIPRNVILKYSKPGELVLDYFCGAGTTAVECKLLGRRCIAFDINDKAIELAKKNVDFNIEPRQLTLMDEKKHFFYEPKLMIGDARDLSFLQDNSVDLICAHPPYANIIHYTDSKESDLSFFDIDDFLKEMSKVARESFRVLKPGRQCAILIGDTRKKKHVIPLGFKLIDVYLDAGFKLRELIIKRQHNCKTTGFWYANSIKYNFLLLAHEYLPIFEKPKVSIHSSVRERDVDFSLLIPALEKPPLKRKLDAIETTTVWILPEKDFEERLNKNVIDRYSKGKGYSTIFFASRFNDELNLSEKNRQKDKQLLFIKSPFLNNAPSRSNIEDYLGRIKGIMDQELPDLNKGGFVVIQTRDVRIDGYIEPLAKRIVDMLTHDNLWLKEIVIVTHDRTNSINQNSRDYLKIIHQYLIIYEVRK